MKTLPIIPVLRPHSLHEGGRDSFLCGWSTLSFLATACISKKYSKCYFFEDTIYYLWYIPLPEKLHFLTKLTILYGKCPSRYTIPCWSLSLQCQISTGDSLWKFPRWRGHLTGCSKIPDCHSPSYVQTQSFEDLKSSLTYTSVLSIPKRGWRNGIYKDS